MQEMVNIYVYGKKYSVPGDLTIMTAMEYAGYKLVRGRISVKTRMRMPSRILRCMCDHLQNQRKK